MMAGIAANLTIFGMLFFKPERIIKMFPLPESSNKSKLDDVTSDTTFLPIDEEKLDEEKLNEEKEYFSRNSSSAPLKSIDSSNCSSTEQLELSEYVYLWKDKRFLLLAARWVKYILCIFVVVRLVNFLILTLSDTAKACYCNQALQIRPT